MTRKALWATLAMACWAGFVATAAAEVNTEVLLEQMTDLQRLTHLPQPAYTCKQFSSYDRASASYSDHRGWFANGDRGQYLRVEENDGRKEHVMVDVDGPGAIVRIWSANPEGNLRVYIDGSDEPAIEANMRNLLGGQVHGFPVPLAGQRAKGWNLYFPIAYAKHCKITSDKGGFYYHVNYRTYEAGTEVTSYSRADMGTYSAKIKEVAERLASPREGSNVPADAERDTVRFSETCIPGPEFTLADIGGSKAICDMQLQIDAEDPELAARGVVLYMIFDGQQTVEVPLGDFFGTAPGLTSYEAMPSGITEGEAPVCWSHWVMPFAKNAVIKVRNFTGQAVEIKGSLATVPYEWKASSLLFHAKWRIERAIPSRPMTDWTHMCLNGQGRFVGGHLHVINPVRNWWGEGDEKIYVDGETFPSTFGTGTEDYYGYAWCSNERFVHAYHNQPLCDGPGNYGNTSVNRFHVIDDIPFTKAFRFDIENWHSHPATDTTRAAVNYWYARPGCRDFFGPITEEQVQLQKIGPYEPDRVEGAIEGEAMKVLEKTGEGTVRTQDLDFLSGARQMWFVNAKPGDMVKLGFKADQGGEKNVLVRGTKADDYAKVQFYVNGHKVGPVIDLYDARVRGSAEMNLGKVQLDEGQNTLGIEIVGANDKAVKRYYVGLDYLRLE